MQQLETETVARLDEGRYLASDLIELKLPLSLPYYNQQQEQYERYEGQIQVNGVWIDFVQRRVSNDFFFWLLFHCQDRNNHMLKKGGRIKE